MRRQREHRDPLGDKVCDEARRAAVIAEILRIRHRAETADQFGFVMVLLDALNGLGEESVQDPLRMMLELAQSKGAKLEPIADVAQWVASTRTEWATDLLAWLYDDGSPAGQRCMVCAVRLPGTAGRRGRPRKYCGEPCKRQATQAVREQETKEDRW